MSDSNLCFDLLEQTLKISSFKELEKLFIEKTAGKDIEKMDIMDFEPSYMTLITNKNIICNGGYDELQAARRCHNLMMKMDKSSLQEQIDKKDFTTKVSVTFIVNEPETTILLLAETYEQIAALIEAVTKDIDDLSSFDGQWYAKAFTTRYKYSNLNSNSEVNAFIWCRKKILEMKLSNEEKLQLPDLGNSANNRGNGNNGGCLTSICLFFILAFSLIC